MRIEGRGRGLMLVLLLVALAFSMALIATPVLAPAVISEPGGTIIAVPPGGEFVLRFRLRWDQAEPGTYAIPLAWDSPRPVVGGVMQDKGSENENFTLVSASAYFDLDNDNLPDPGLGPIEAKAEPLEGPSPENEEMWRYGVIVANTAADPRNGEFNVDVLFRAAGAGGVPHAVTENHPIVIMGTIDVFEKAMFMYTPPNPYVTIRVYELTPPTKPILSTPPNDEFTNDNTPTFEWTPGENADNHRLLVDNDSNFSSPMENRLLGAAENAYTPTIGYPDGAYFWKVVAINAAGENSSEVWTFTIDTTPPGKPTLISPVDGAWINDNTPTLSWTAASDALSGIDYYEVQVDNNSNFSSPENAGTTTSTSYTVGNGLKEGAQYWRVRAVDKASNAGAWENDWFRVDVTPPSKPTLIWPANGENINDNSPNLDWGAVSDASPPVLYRVRVSDNSAFPHDNVDSGWISADNFKLATQLREGVWYWRVQVRDNAGNVGENSQTRSFRVDVTSPPAPALLEPADGAMTTDNTPTFRWAAVADNSMPVTYGLQVDNDPDFSSPEIDVPRLVDNAYTPIAGLPFGNYSWRVQATDNAGNVGDWSLAWTLQIIPTRGVEVTISPGENTGVPGGILTYRVTVKNTGNIEDNYSLENRDNLGWQLSLDDALLLNLPAGGSRITTLRVTIPDGAAPGTRDNITVRAVGTEVENSAVCAAIVAAAAGVEVSVSPSENSGMSGTTLSYTVTVKNTGLIRDNYTLTATDTLGWVPTLSPTLLSLEPDSSGTATLSIVVPANAPIGAEDTITVTATSQRDGTVSASATCKAYSGHRTVIRPSDDAYVWARQEDRNYNTGDLIIGVYDDGSFRAWLKFDLSSIPSSEGVVKARLWLYFHDSLGGGAPGGIAAHFSENDSWLETGITWRNQPSFFPVRTDNIPGFTEVGWRSWTVTSDVQREFEGDKKVTWCLKEVTVGGDDYNVAYSKQHDNVSLRPYLEVFHEPVYRVSISISPSENSGLPGSTLTYKVTVKNAGAFDDTYALDNADVLGWPLSLDNVALSVPASENRATTLRVTVPGDALAGQVDNITITASGTGASASATCIARAAALRKVEISISPENRSGTPGATLTYTVTVKNTGNAADNYKLTVKDNAVPSWAPTISPENLTLAAGASGTATLSVKVPENIAGIVSDNIRVTATSLTDNKVSASASCVARAEVTRGVEVTISPGENSGPPGATLTYKVTVKNTGNVPDNYSLTTSDNENWIRTISPTLLTVPAGENRTATLSVTIPSGAAHSRRDNVRVVATSQADNKVSASGNCTAHAVIIRKVEISISPTSASGAPGATLTYTVAVKNAGNVFDNYDLTAADNMGWKLTLSPTSLAMHAGENRTATLSVTIPGDATHSMRSLINVTATSRLDNAVSASASCEAHATTAKKVEISISPSFRSGQPGTTLVYTVTIRNIGQVDDTYALSATSAVGWTAYIEPTSISLAAGASGEAKVSITIPSDVSEGTSMTINVKATSTTDPAVSSMETCRVIALGPSVPLPSPLPVVPLAISAALAITAAVTIKFFQGRVRRPRLFLREGKVAKRRVLREVSWGR